MSDAELRTAIQEAQIDIIVDLGGHTADGRILALAQRAAPIQITYLGYPATVGAQFIDYAIVDKFVVPESAAEFFTEKLAYLPHCYLVSDRKRPTAGHIPSRAECNLPPDAFVFCCFNGAYKIAPAVFDHWMRILIAVPESVLWLLADNRWAQDNLRQEARKRVDPARLVFMPRGLTQRSGALRLADLSDTCTQRTHDRE
jgi:predicted O-linked N-acetylglucosamine transferase (SPINDLY family)